MSDHSCITDIPSRPVCSVQQQGCYAAPMRCELSLPSLWQLAILIGAVNGIRLWPPNAACQRGIRTRRIVDIPQGNKTEPTVVRLYADHKDYC